MLVSACVDEFNVIQRTFIDPKQAAEPLKGQFCYFKGGLWDSCSVLWVYFFTKVLESVKCLFLIHPGF